MSTRGCIAIRQGDGWRGRYHHFDSYPDGLGRTLWKLYHGHFKRDLKAMVKYLIDDHPAGWSSINDADFSLEPGYNASMSKLDEKAPRAPACYCHGDRQEGASEIDSEKNPDPLFIEWVYVFDIERRMMTVLAGEDLDPYTASPAPEGHTSGSWKRPDGFWEYDGSAYRHVLAGIIDLDGEEPVWGDLNPGEGD